MALTSFPCYLHILQQVQFIVAFMSIVYIAAVTSSDSSAYSLHAPSNVNAQFYASYANDVAIGPARQRDGKGGGGAAAVKMSNVNDSLKSYPHRRSYSATLSAALNGLRDYTGLQHISSSYMPIPKAVKSTTSSDNLDGSAIEAKQQIPIYEEQPEYDYSTAAAGVSAASATSLGTSTHTQPPFNGENNQYSANDALSTAIYNLHEAGTHNNYYGGNTATSTTTSASEWPASGNAAWSQTDDFQQFLQANDKSKVNSFQYEYEYERPQYTQYTQQQQQHAQQEYFTPQQYTQTESVENESHYEEPNNYLSKPDEQIDTEAHYKQQPDVINYIPYPVVKKLHVPVHQPIQIPVSHAVIMPVSKPVPIHIPVTQQVQVPVEKDLRIPVERIVPYPVEKHVPVPVEKRVPYPVVRYVPVKVPRPYPIKVPVYKTVLHKMKSLW